LQCLHPGEVEQFVLTVSIDAEGSIQDVETDHGAFSTATACAAVEVRRSQWWLKPGPSRLTIAYFIGQSDRPRRN
jgi:hypothetical protein